MDLAELLATRIDDRDTSMPAGVDATIGEVPGLGWSAFDDLVPPILLLRDGAIAHNLRLMADYCSAAGVSLAPHGKTSMAPQLWARQVDAGAWGIAAATPGQARVMRRTGVPRILLANELVDRAAISWVARELADPGFWFACWVDSMDGVERLRASLAAAGAPRPLPVLVEVGHPGGRSGARMDHEVLAVAASARAAPELRLVGVAAYEGTVADRRDAESLDEVDRYLRGCRRAAEMILDRGLLDEADEAIVTAGGSSFFDRVVDVLAGEWGREPPVRVVLRAGCYVTHDHGLYARLSPFASREDADRRFRPAFEGWGSVLSRPEPGLAIVGIGKRDVPADVDPPIPLLARGDQGPSRPLQGASVRRLMDQHAICEGPPGVLPAVGELMGFGISHPCTTFDRRRLIPVVDDDDRVVEVVATFF
jgi:D-serine deaminase-like pyridoxal phosphate-dependent protein